MGVFLKNVTKLNILFQVEYFTVEQMYFVQVNYCHTLKLIIIM